MLHARMRVGAVIVRTASREGKSVLAAPRSTVGRRASVTAGRVSGASESAGGTGAGWTLGAYIKGDQLAQFAPSAPERDPVDHYVSEVVIHGTPEAVREQLAKLRAEMFLDYLMCAPLSHESFLLFTDAVLPKLS